MADVHDIQLTPLALVRRVNRDDPAVAAASRVKIHAKDPLWRRGRFQLGDRYSTKRLRGILPNILLFDNGISESRVIEITVPSGDIVWSYQPGKQFFTAWGGRCQRLPNGNTLITETARGYAFEVTPDGEVVWKFAVPDVSRNGERTALWQMVRYTELDLPFVEEIDPPTTSKR